MAKKGADIDYAGLSGPLLTSTTVALAAAVIGLAGCAASSAPPAKPSSAAASPITVAKVAPLDCGNFHQPLSTSRAEPPAASAVRTVSRVSALSGVEAIGANEDDEPPILSQLPPFSSFGPDRVMPAGWHSWTVNRSKTPTQYALTEVDQRVVLHARADSSASGLYVPLTPREPGKLRWAWKTRDVIADGDNASGPKEDAPLRLFVAFDGDKSTLSLKDHLMDEMARLMTGREMPYATLMYIWGAKRPAGTVIPNPHTERVRMIVVDSGTRHAKQWRCHERDLRADYRAAFGKEPGRLLAVGIMTDTDNTKSQAEAWYGDIALD